MKSLSLILAFLPLIVFSVLARFLPHGYIGVAGLVAAVAALIAIAASRPIRPPKILNICSLVLFALIAVLGFTLGKNDDRWLATWGGAGVGIILGLTILALLPLMPFTEQFARESVPQAYWSSPTFKQINRVLSAAWGVAIFGVGVSRIAAAAINGHTTRRLPELLLGLIVPGAIILYMLKFSKSYPDRSAGTQARAGGVGPAAQG
jgi:intracellular septation protein A